MKRMILSLVQVMVLCSASAFAEIKPCEERKAEIEVTLKANGCGTGQTASGKEVPLEKVHVISHH
jgi:hypothetical protein